jgi:anthranilate synthase/aminodeoxychorismate synthase-like glutamine amidotransferase
MEILVIDNDDSFTYNLVQLLKKASASPIVVNHSNLDTNICKNYKKILLSPGPGLPSHYQSMTRIIDEYKEFKSILGVCLGHQAIVEYFGTELRKSTKPHHGEKSSIRVIVNDPIFSGLPDQFFVGRYHSWVANEINSTEIEATAIDNNNEIMAIRHTQFDIRGLQFHPESYITEYGLEIIQNWLKL